MTSKSAGSRTKPTCAATRAGMTRTCPSGPQLCRITPLRSAGCTVTLGQPDPVVFTVTTSPVNRVTVYVFPALGAPTSAIAGWLGTALNTMAAMARAGTHHVLLNILSLKCAFDCIYALAGKIVVTPVGSWNSNRLPLCLDAITATAASKARTRASTRAFAKRRDRPKAYRLPPYAPELDPAEGVWANLTLGRAIRPSTASLVSALHGSVRDVTAQARSGPSREDCARTGADRSIADRTARASMG